MQAITDEQYREIARAIRAACVHFDTTENNLLAEGRAAVEKAAPYLYYPLTPDERVRYFYSEIDVDVILEKRLAQYTVKPDPRVEAAIEAMKPWANHNCSDESMKLMRKAAQDVVAAIDAAGGKQ